MLALLSACVSPVAERAEETACTSDCGGEDSAGVADSGDDSSSDSAGDTATPPIDADDDGFDEVSDCDDRDPTVHPDATEVCNGGDDDCDGAIDDADPGVVGMTTWYEDRDRDGYGDATTTATACERPANFVATAGDCDDAVGSTNPGVSEVCGDGADNDCDGTANGCGIRDMTLSAGTVEAVLVGETAGEAAGTTVAGAGDVDGDGLDDVFVGAPDADTRDENSGQAYIVLGAATGTLDLGTADAAPAWAYDDIHLTTAVAPVGDWDADGYDDLFFGTSFPSGLVYAWQGGATLTDTIVGAFGDDEDSSCYCGSALGAGGDVTGDGSPDLVVGCWGWTDAGADSGRVAVVTSAKFAFGTKGVELADIDAATRTGIAAGAWVGKAVAIAGDTDGDGVDDLVIGAPGAVTVYVEFGPISGTSGVSGTDESDVGAAGSEYGTAVAAAGDVGADGYGDIVVGSPGIDGGVVWAGGTLGAMNHGSFVFSGGERAGASVATAGDLDSEGSSDLLIGAPGYQAGGTAYGASYVLYGPVSGAIDLDLDAVVLRGGAAGDLAGTSVAAAGDVDGDASRDVLIGAPGHDDAGAAYLISGGGW